MPTPVGFVQTEKVVVISPSDVKDERMVLLDVIEELNRTVARAYHVHLKLWAWETDSFPGFHKEGPQGLIDELLGEEKPDIVVGIFWHRIGTLLGTTEAGGAATGTTHEFQAFHDHWKADGRPQILFYFKKEPYFPRDRHDLAQWDGVFQFQEKFPTSGFSWNFRDTREFETLVRNHLAMALVKKYGSTFAKGVSIVDSEEDRKTALLAIVANAESRLLTTGSRGHETAYFEKIEEAIRDKPGLSYYRILFGQPRNDELKQHLYRVQKIAEVGRPGVVLEKRVFISIYDNNSRQAEVSLCANEEQVLIALPSLNRFGKFDSAILFTDPEKLRALERFVDDLERRGRPVRPEDLEVPDVAPDSRDVRPGDRQAT